MAIRSHYRVSFSLDFRNTFYIRGALHYAYNLQAKASRLPLCLLEFCFPSVQVLLPSLKIIRIGSSPTRNHSPISCEKSR